MLLRVDRTSCDVIRSNKQTVAQRMRSAADRGNADQADRGGSAVADGVRSGGFDRRQEKSSVGSYVEVGRFARRRAARERPFVTACYK